VPATDTWMFSPAVTNYGLCMSVPSGNMTNGTVLILWDNYGGTDQKWKVLDKWQ